MSRKFIGKFDISFIKMLMILAAPIILQNLISASLNLLDNIMIGHLGVNEIAAVGLSNQYYLLFYYTVMGISLGAGSFYVAVLGEERYCKYQKILEFLLRFLLL